MKMYLTNQIITLWRKLVLWEKEHFSFSAEYFQTRQSQRELEQWGFSPLHCGIEGALLAGQKKAVPVPEEAMV